jgi:hypothetical protein
MLNASYEETEMPDCVHETLGQMAFLVDVPS